MRTQKQLEYINEINEYITNLGFLMKQLQSSVNEFVYNIENNIENENTQLYVVYSYHELYGKHWIVTDNDFNSLINRFINISQSTGLTLNSIIGHAIYMNDKHKKEVIYYVEKIDLSNDKELFEIIRKYPNQFLDK